MTHLCAYTCWYVQGGAGQMLTVVAHMPLISQDISAQTT